MTESPAAAACPYVGLVPFSEGDAEYFFGRENDIEVVATNLRATRVTILYGASGVGKSSLIGAGVVPLLQKLTAISVLPDEPPDFLLIMVRDWANDPVDSLRSGIAEAVERAVIEGRFPQLTLEAVRKMAAQNESVASFSEILENWTTLIETKLLIILDQFEGFFLHPEFCIGENSFGEEFPKIINKTNLPVNFMISLRDDAISKLDIFKGKIPELLNNTLRLRHLDKTQAEEAIRRPLKQYYDETGTLFTVEDELIEQVLRDVRVGNIKFGTQGQAVVKQFETPENNSSIDSTSSQIEAPFLQLVMMKMWKNEMTQREQALTKDILINEKKLGGVQKIVETYLDEAMNHLKKSEKYLAAEFIHFTVTRSGAKITSNAADLAVWADIPEREKDIDGILTKLSGDARIYKTVFNMNDPQTNYYEVTHDALTPAILNWRTRYENRKNIIKIGVPIFALIILGSLAFGIWQRSYADEAEFKEIEAKNDEANLKTIIESLSDLTNDSDEQRNAAIANLNLLKTRKEIPEDINESLTALVEKITEQYIKNKRQAADLKQIFSIKTAITPTPQTTQTPKTTISPTAATTVSPTPASTISQNSDENIPPRVYIHITDEDQRAKARDIEKLLESGKFNIIVPGIQNVGKGPRVTEVRFFRENDRGEAERVVNILESQGIKAKPVPLNELWNPVEMRPKHLELYFAADAFN